MGPSIGQGLQSPSLCVEQVFFQADWWAVQCTLVYAGLPGWFLGRSSWVAQLWLLCVLWQFPPSHKRQAHQSSWGSSWPSLWVDTSWACVGRWHHHSWFVSTVCFCSSVGERFPKLFFFFSGHMIVMVQWHHIFFLSTVFLLSTQQRYDVVARFFHSGF